MGLADGSIGILHLTNLLSISQGSEFVLDPWELFEEDGVTPLDVSWAVSWLWQVRTGTNLSTGTLLASGTVAFDSDGTDGLVIGRIAGSETASPAKVTKNASHALIGIDGVGRPYGVAKGRVHIIGMAAVGP